MDLTQEGYKRLLFERTERIKELGAINGTTEILKQEEPIEQLLQEVCNILPAAWQYPEFTVARIIYAGKEYKTEESSKPPGRRKRDFPLLMTKPAASKFFT